MEEIQIEIQKLEKDLEINRDMINNEDNAEMKSMITEEITRLEKQLEALNHTLSAMKGDTWEESEEGESENNAILSNTATIEIRSGTGGDEAGIFADDLYRMYTRFSELQGWKIRELFRSENIAGGIKTVSAEIKGKDVYNFLRYESGVHRVQRVPITESSGRIHTSTATVAVLPKLKNFQIDIKPEDLKWDFFRSGGKGGQNVNKVSTAVRLTHTPTQLVFECQEERTQGRNREKALEMLTSSLYTMMQEQRVQSITEIRSTQVGTGERNEKIRTYNYPQSRITDHRIKQSWHNLTGIMNGEILEMLTTVRECMQKQKQESEV